MEALTLSYPISGRGGWMPLGNLLNFFNSHTVVSLLLILARLLL